MMLHVHEDKFSDVFYTDVGEADQVQWLHHNLATNPTILEVLLLLEVELNVVCLRGVARPLQSRHRRRYLMLL